MQALRAEAKTYRDIATQIATKFGVHLPPMSIKRILDRQHLARGAAKDVGSIKKANSPEDDISHAEGLGSKNMMTSGQERARFGSAAAPVIREMQRRGCSIRGIAIELDKRKMPMPRGGSWPPQLAERIVERLDVNQTRG